VRTAGAGEHGFTFPGERREASNLWPRAAAPFLGPANDRPEWMEILATVRLGGRGGVRIRGIVC
jgi:hypothetical protein